MKTYKIYQIKFLTITSFVLSTIALLGISKQIYNNFLDDVNLNINKLKHGKWRNLTKQQIDSLSKLGRILYLDDEYPEYDSSRNYTILVWKYGSTIDDRHVKRYSGIKQDPLEFCSVKNCKLTYKSEDLDNVDIVIMHMHRMKGADDLPPQNNRKPEQIWAFLTDESPYHMFMRSSQKLSDYNDIFNWSMTYRLISDIPVPYGRTVMRDDLNTDEKFNVNSWLLTKKHDVPVAIMGSNCGSKNHRWEYVRELKKHIKVDVYGKCGTLKCPGHFGSNCRKLDRYMFYLAFENSNCKEYITEKLWWQAYHKNSIPIVMGGPKSFYNNLLPPNSFIHIDDFATSKDLATYLNYLIVTPEILKGYFAWKKYFKVLNEHGYFKSVSQHYCRVCEALNYNSRKTKVYNDLEKFWSLNQCSHASMIRPQFKVFTKFLLFYKVALLVLY